LSLDVDKLKLPSFDMFQIQDGITDGVADDDHVIEIIVAAEMSCVPVKIKVHSQVLRVLSQLRALSVKYITVPELISFLETKLKESGESAFDITIKTSHTERFVYQKTKDIINKLKNIPKNSFNLGIALKKFFIVKNFKY